MELAYQPDFSGKTAVVTGGAGILCGDFCRALAQCGAKVAILDRDIEKAEVLATELCAKGQRALAVSVDVLDEDSVRKAHETVLGAFGACDILINGAGGNNPSATTDDEFFSEDVLRNPEKKSFFDIPSQSFSKVFSLNILGVLLPTQAFARDMINQKRGCILNISSMNAYTPLTKIPAYSSAKAGVSNFTQWLAVYFSQTGIRCNAIAPGFFSTTQNAALLWNPDGTPTARTGKILNATPMGRFGLPSELLGALMFFCDEKASGFVTGVVLPVDGGFSAYSGV